MLLLSKEREKNRRGRKLRLLKRKWKLKRPTSKN
jgi:hypothetical protein